MLLIKSKQIVIKIIGKRLLGTRNKMRETGESSSVLHFG